MTLGVQRITSGVVAFAARRTTIRLHRNSYSSPRMRALPGVLLFSDHRLGSQVVNVGQALFDAQAIFVWQALDA
jgi:hypothetical protein